MYVKEEKSRCSLSKPFSYNVCFLANSASDLGLHSAAKLSVEQERSLPLGRAPGVQPGAMAASRVAEVRQEPGLELGQSWSQSLNELQTSSWEASARFRGCTNGPQGGCRGPGVGAPRDSAEAVEGSQR